MLETTLATTFTPGSNLKGQVAGANWTFLLPSLEVERIVILGKPSAAALTTLTRLGQLTVIFGDEEGLLAFEGEEHICRASSLETAIVREDGKLAVPDRSSDLVVVSRVAGRQLLARVEGLLDELQRILKPHGVLYFEPGGLLTAGSQMKQLAASFEATATYWLTPMGGECHTAVPIQHSLVMAYFLDRRLNTPSITTRTFGPAKNLLKRGRRTQQARPAGAGIHAPTRPSVRSHFLSRVRTGAKDFLALLAGVERFTLRHASAIRRHGALLGFSPYLQPGQLPQYLVDLAAEAGADCATVCRWGMVARGDYSSRKVLFFLFTGERQGAEEMEPESVVKMVRDSRYNARLENEHRALLLLQEMGVGDPDRVPGVSFWGYHNDLAILGETAIDGVSFRERTSYRADCRYLLDALDWLTMLGSTSADLQTATAAEVAMSLGTLFDRFSEIYRLNAVQKDFLREQLATIAESPHSFPLVFQHGDPGTWNVVVAPGEKVAFLDWEAAEPQGMPLWDLFYFMRSYAVGAARASGTQDRLQGFAEQLLSDTPLSRLFVEKVKAYRKCTGLHSTMVEPLFYTCWMHRALKESTRLSPSQLEQGHYVNLLRYCIAGRDAGVLGRLFSQVARDRQAILMPDNGRFQ